MGSGRGEWRRGVSGEEGPGEVEGFYPGGQVDEKTATQRAMGRAIDWWGEQKDD
jgi:hypothetical protein